MIPLYPTLANLAPAADPGPGMEGAMMRLVLQLAVILIAAQLVGLFFKRLLRLPGVLGELIAGMIIGPYALGRLPIPGFGPLFPAVDTPVAVSVPLYGLATIASILLLFLSGLETDLALFLRYSVVGTAVGIGGVVFSFFLGAQCGVWFGLANSIMDPVALFLGAISTATSVGITARILSERKKTDSPEGVTILAGAVFDDVLGVVILAIVVGLSKLTDPGDRAP
jgi:Kef-type K+ transport system membrane component KefB